MMKGKRVRKKRKMNKIPIRIVPTKATETISISLVEYTEKFRQHFKSAQATDFFVFGKTVVGNNMYLEIRSLRVNDFIQMLDDFKIRWRHITEPYK